MTIETSVALEFMSSKERKESFTSSPCNFAKAEEVEELMADAYPVNASEKTVHLETRSVSKTSYDGLIDSC